MKLVTEYLADAAVFDHLAALEQDPQGREQLQKQALANRKLSCEPEPRENRTNWMPQSGINSRGLTCDSPNKRTEIAPPISGWSMALSQDWTAAARRREAV
jgi:hypothetical protein